MSDKHDSGSPASEPVAWMDAHDHTNLYYRKPTQVDVVPLYAHPPAALPELAALIMRETGEDRSGNLRHEPREALLILREAAQAALAARPAMPEGWLREAMKLVGRYAIAVAKSEHTETEEWTENDEAAKVAYGKVIDHLRLAEQR